MRRNRRELTPPRTICDCDRYGSEYYAEMESLLQPSEAEPTAARPGTPEKVDVMRQRLELGQELHADDDVNRWKGIREATTARIEVCQDKAAVDI